MYNKVKDDNMSYTNSVHLLDPNVSSLFRDATTNKQGEDEEKDMLGGRRYLPSR